MAGLVYQYRANVRLSAEVAELSGRSASPQSTREGLMAGPGLQGTAGGAREAQVAGNVGPRVSPVVGLAKGLMPADTLGDHGRATAHDAFATQIWAARTGNVNLEASTLAFSARSRAKLEALETSLPAEYQAEYPTPEKLMAFALTGSPHPVGGVEILGETSEGPDDVTLQTEWQHVDDTEVHQSDVNLHRGDDGWKLVVPDVLVNRAVTYLSRHAQAPAPHPGN